MSFVTGSFNNMDRKSYTDQIDDQVESGNYHAAINIALSGMNEGRRNKDQAGIDKYIQIIKDITVKLEQEFGSNNRG